MRYIPVLALALAAGAAACSQTTSERSTQSAQAAPQTSQQNAGVKLGLLTCDLGGRTNAVLITKETLDCTFDPNNGQPVAYQGQVKKFGLDLQIKSNEKLGWAVLAPSMDMGPDALAGTYGGVSGSAALGVGAGANALVGGFNDSIVLQPFSVSGSTGVGAALGVESLTLSRR